jgi:plasmid stability protein
MKESLRQLHVKLPEELHRQLRIKAASDDKTVQQLVIDILSARMKETESLSEATEEDQNGE